MAEGRFNDIATGISTIVGALGAIAAGIGAWQASLAKDRAEAATRQVQEAQRLFEQQQYQDKRQFELYEKIEGLLKDNQPGALVLATSYVSLVKDADAKEVWCSTVLSYAHIRETQLTSAERSAVLYAKDCLTDAAERRSQETVATQAATTPAAPPPSAAIGSWPDKQVIAAGKPLGYDIDVFACESAGAGSLDRARKVAERLARQSAENGKLAHAILGRVRLRTLTRQQEQSGGYPAGSNQVQADQDDSEQVIARTLASLAGEASEQKFSVGRSSSGTDFYLSVFACGP